MEVAHAVSSDNHGGMLFAKCFYDGLQRLFGGVEVVAIELYGKAAASLVVEGCVPTSADAQVGA